MMDERAIDSGRRAIDSGKEGWFKNPFKRKKKEVKKTLTVSRSGFNDYITRVRAEVPVRFEKDLCYIRLATSTASYIYHCYLHDVDPKDCANKMIEKFGVDNESQ